MNQMYVFKVDEYGCVDHWVTAPDADSAIQRVRETCSIPEVADDPVWQVELHAEQLPDDRLNTLWLDAECDPTWRSSRGARDSPWT